MESMWSVTAQGGLMVTNLLQLVVTANEIPCNSIVVYVVNESAMSGLEVCQVIFS